MRIVHISDTHCQENAINHKLKMLQDVDMIIHSGDCTMIGEEREFINFLNWFENLHFKYKILIMGNHDKSFDPKFWNGGADPNDRWPPTPDSPVWTKAILEQYQSKENQFYLHDTSVVIEGKKFWGSPFSRWFHGEYWAFNLKPEHAYKKYRAIPKDTDVVITHGPALGKLDWTKNHHYAGDEQLRNRIQEIKPKYHLFGHIHEAYGEITDGDTIYLNSSIMDVFYEPTNDPQVFEL